MNYSLPGRPPFPPWLRGLIALEMLFDVPFFFFAIFAFANSTCLRLRTPTAWLRYCMAALMRSAPACREALDSCARHCVRLSYSCSADTNLVGDRGCPHPFGAPRLRRSLLLSAHRCARLVVLRERILPRRRSRSGCSCWAYTVRISCCRHCVGFGWWLSPTFSLKREMPPAAKSGQSRVDGALWPAAIIY